MKNFTLTHTREKSCCKSSVEANFLIRRTLGNYDKSILTIPYHHTDNLAGLTFVGCGQNGMSLLPFQELVNVFDSLSGLELW